MESRPNALHRRFGLPIVYLTAHGDRETIERAKEAEPLAFLMKPFKPLELTSSIQIALERALADRELREREQSLLVAMGSIGDAVLSTDEHGRVEFINQAAESLTGWTQDEALGRPIGEIVHIAEELAGVPHPSPLSGQATECRIVSRAGASHWVLARATNITGPNGRSTRVAVLQDITSRKESERALERLAELIGFAHDAIITTGADRVIHGWNKGAEEMYGWTEAEAVGHVTYDFLQTRSAVSSAEIDQCLFRDRRWDGEISQVRRDGGRIIVDSRKVLQRDAAGAAVGILEINRDITGRRRAEEALQKSLRELEAALKEKTVLLKEVHHRVKNNLAVICGLLNMNAGATEIAEAKLALAESQQRVYSIALIHEQLYGTDHLDRINFADYIRQLVGDLNVAFGAATRRISIRIDAEPIELGVHRAVPCALILNELVANAFKHAFPAQQQDNEVRISFRESGAGYLELRIEDNGVGCPPGMVWHDAKSVGSHIVSILTKQLDGSFTQEPSPGAHFVLRFPAGTSSHATPDRSFAASPKA